MGGSVVILAERRRQQQPEVSAKDVAYDNLQRLETELFGEQKQGLSFLERIAAETDTADWAAGTENIGRAGDIYALDACGTRYLDFACYDSGRYKEFLSQAMMYFYHFESSDTRTRDRILGVARNLFRYESCLPSLADAEGIAEANRTLGGRLRYSLREMLASRKLQRFWNSSVTGAVRQFSADANTKTAE
ncbi:hypothetical protein KY359_02090 [Candidatus Woesearchaeota archaeon]|nr:hypothetical protein [Candidatus Woesearchaeota archaeon]